MDELLVQALETVGLPVKYYEYKGTAPEYIVYNEEAEQRTNHGDNHALNRVEWWQVHIFTPRNGRFREYKRAAEKALLRAGFGVTEIVTLYEGEDETETMHVVISCNGDCELTESEE